MQAFERASSGLGRPAAPSTAELTRAADLYTGDLLDTLEDEWLGPVRHRLHERALEVLETLAAQLERSGERARALHAWERLLTLEPLRESGYAAMMRLHLLGGDAAAAQQVYRRCAELLSAELKVRPGQAVQAEYARLQRGAPSPPPTPPGEGPLIGRRPEWQRLLRVWHEASAGAARVLLIAGEAGIGKTRLAEALLSLAGAQGASTARTRSYAAEGRLAYAPISDWLRSPALGAGLARLGEPWRSELARLLPELAPPASASSAAELPSQGWQRQRLFEALSKAVLAGGGPTLLLLDDLQWCDRDTLEWLHFLLRFAPTAPLLLLCTLRSEEVFGNPALRTFMQDLQQRGGLERLNLGPLTREETGELAASLAEADFTAGAHSRVVSRLSCLRPPRASRCLSWKRCGPGLSFGGESGPLAFPASPRVQAVIAARLEQLSTGSPQRRATGRHHRAGL